LNHSLRNAGDHPLTVKPVLFLMESGKPRIVKLPPEHFAPGEARQLSFAQTLSNFNGMATLTLTYEGHPGDLLIATSSVSLESPPSIFRTLFQVPYPVSPLLGILTKTPGVWGYFGTCRRVDVSTCRRPGSAHCELCFLAAANSSPESQPASVGCQAAFDPSTKPNVAMTASPVKSMSGLYSSLGW
jgi:hypothetical protein